jgi:hypothetical protein
METLQNDIVPKYVKVVSIRKQLQFARDQALWWRKERPCEDFFTYPNPIDNADSRINHLCFGLLSVANIFLNHYFSFPWLGIYIIYTYLAKTVCGPKLDIQSLIVLFVLSPLICDRFSLINDEIKAAPPKRFAMFFGWVTATVAFFVGTNGYLVESYYIWGLLALLGFSCGFFDLCLGCFLFSLLTKLGLIDPTISETCNLNFVQSKRNLKSHTEKGKIKKTAADNEV